MHLAVIPKQIVIFAQVNKFVFLSGQIFKFVPASKWKNYFGLIPY